MAGHSAVLDLAVGNLVTAIATGPNGGGSEFSTRRTVVLEAGRDTRLDDGSE